MPGPNAGSESFRYNVNTTQTASAGIVYLTSSGKSRNVDPHRESRPATQGFLDYLWLTDYEITDPVLSGANASRASSTRGSGTRDRGRNYGPIDWQTCQAVYWIDSAVVERTGALERRPVRVRQPDDQRRHRHVLQLARRANNVANSMKFGGSGVVLNPLGVPRTLRICRAPATRRAVAAAVPAGEHVDQEPGRRRAGRHRLPVHRDHDDHAEERRRHRQDGRDEPQDAVDEQRVRRAGCRDSANLPANGVIYVQNVPTAISDPNHSSCSGTGVQRRREHQRHVERPADDRVAQNDINIIGNVQYHQYPGGTDVLGLVAEQRRRGVPPGLERRATRPVRSPIRRSTPRSSR